MSIEELWYDMHTKAKEFNRKIKEEVSTFEKFSIWCMDNGYDEGYECRFVRVKGGQKNLLSTLTLFKLVK